MELNPNNVPIISGAISAGSGLLSGIANIGSTLLTNKANKELAQYSFEQQRQMIREQNEYNSPQAQMARYKEAGLNPNLIYGDGSSMSGNQQSIARYEAPILQAPEVRMGLNEALQMALQYRSQQADIKLKEEQAYAQRMLGLGYEQDAYMKAVDNAVKSMNAGLKTPHGLWSTEELDQIRQGNMVRRYKSETEGVDINNALHRAQTAYQNLNAREKQFFIENLLPLQEKMLTLQAEGLSYENIIKQIDSETERLVRMSNIGASPFRAAYVLGGVLGDRLREAWEKIMQKYGN